MFVGKTEEQKMALLSILEKRGEYSYVSTAASTTGTDEIALLKKSD
jgi:hypothetical protein